MECLCVFFGVVFFLCSLVVYFLLKKVRYKFKEISEIRVLLNIIVKFNFFVSWDFDRGVI